MVPVTGARMMVSGELRGGKRGRALGLHDRAPRGVDLFLPGADFHEVIGLLQRIHARDGGAMARFSVVEGLLGENSFARQRAGALEGHARVFKIGLGLI